MSNPGQMPSKVLRIHELMFVLPDDFSGTVNDAINEFMKYREEHVKNARIIDPENQKTNLDILSGDSSFRVSGDVILYEFSRRTNRYELIDGSFINYDVELDINPEV